MLTNCEYCKKEYYIRPSHYKRNNHHFCSKKCYGLAETGDNNPAWKNNFIRCPICGEEFKPKQQQIYCSQKCMGIADHLKNSKKAQCIVCGKEFETKKSLNPVTCSKKCANKLHSIAMTSEGNPNWRDGISSGEYGIEFTNKLKYEIKKRDNFVCQICGLPNEENFSGNGYGLSIHHIDYNKQNNDPSNLISLCNHCHAKTNYNREKWKKLLLQRLQK